LKRYLLLSDGSYFAGKALGAPIHSVGEVVFNTGMTGYQEILTDPSYAGQIVMLTYPMIGNYGINEDDFESDRIQVSGLIVREACEFPSNWRSTRTIDQLLKDRNIGAIQGLDTRMITKHIRSAGVTMGVLCDDLDQGKEVLSKSNKYEETDFVQTVTTKTAYKWGPEGKESAEEPDPSGRPRLVVLDCGLKFNILRRFWKAGCRPIVLPCNATAEEVLSWKPDGIFLSPGPGDPQRLTSVVKTVQTLLGTRPMFGICLGNQLLCHAAGGTTFKMKFGHRGSNHAVRDLQTGKVTITSQNHGYAVDPNSLQGTRAVVTQINVNDNTVEGISIPEADATSIQYHPEAAPGPWDSRPYFTHFVEKLKSNA
jgi:carbamoyl-phosphate synthase small subunit